MGVRRQMKKVVHIITGLNTGGAEMMLYKLASSRALSGFRMEVISLGSVGPVGDRIREAGIPVSALNMRPQRPNGTKVARLVRILRRMRPDVVQTWLYHADLIGGMAAKVAGVRGLVWNIRVGTLDLKSSRRSTLLVARMCARLSSWLPSRVVSCSDGGASNILNSAIRRQNSS